MARGLADCLVTNGIFSHFLLQNKAYIGQSGKFRRVSITNYQWKIYKGQNGRILRRVFYANRFLIDTG